MRTQAEEQRGASAAPLPASHQSARKISTSRIIDALKELPSDDITLIEKVVESDGVVRYAVYINETIGNITKVTVENYYSVHGWGWNVEASFNAKTPAETLIAETLRRRHADNGQSGAEVMLVGYSQGGMVPQTLADREKFNVKEVLTIGSPQGALTNGHHGTHVARLFHNGDQAENSIEIARAPVLGLPLDILVYAFAGGTHALVRPTSSVLAPRATLHKIYIRANVTGSRINTTRVPTRCISLLGNVSPSF